MFCSSSAEGAEDSQSLIKRKPFRIASLTVPVIGRVAARNEDRMFAIGIVQLDSDRFHDEFGLDIARSKLHANREKGSPVEELPFSVPMNGMLTWHRCAVPSIERRN